MNGFVRIDSEKHDKMMIEAIKNDDTLTEEERKEKLKEYKRMSKLNKDILKS